MVKKVNTRNAAKSASKSKKVEKSKKCLIVPSEESSETQYSTLFDPNDRPTLTKSTVELINYQDH